MAPRDLINELQNAAAPSRTLDIALGIAVGYKRRVIEGKLKGTGVRNVVWSFGSAGPEASLPHFTESVQDVVSLVRALRPQSVGGLSWDEEGGAARIDRGPYFTASNEAIALCMALVHAELLEVGDEHVDNFTE